MVKPYRQYLNKFAQVMSFKIESGNTNDDFSERSYIEQVFCQYNLMIFTCGTLSESVLQF